MGVSEASVGVGGGRIVVTLMLSVENGERRSQKEVRSEEMLPDT